MGHGERDSCTVKGGEALTEIGGIKRDEAKSEMGRCSQRCSGTVRNGGE